MLKGNYKINGNKIFITNIDNYLGDVCFKIINNKTLERIENGAIFVKEILNIAKH